MTQTQRYESAKAIYATYGVDTDEAIAKLKEIPVALHCWQGDDVTGFDHDGPLTGGIQTTGNYPGKARTPQDLMADMDLALRLMPGKKKLNLHACYAIFEDGEFVDRDAIEPKHFAKWVEFAKERNMGIDFNPTFFSHDKVKDGLTLSSPDRETREFWIRHGQACIRISEYFAKETGVPCVMNIWTGDGYKDIPADRLGPRMRYKESIEEILSIPFDKNLVKPCVESKVFGIGVEAYTVGSAEFTLSFAATHEGCLPLMDNGHYHPTEVVSDKIPALLCFFKEIALHITRPIRWDSDHVVLFDDETKEMAKEIVRCNGLNRTYMALDYFDASINRISAWVNMYINGQYRGMYMVTELIEVAKDRVEVEDGVNGTDKGFLIELDFRGNWDGGTLGLDYFYVEGYGSPMDGRDNPIEFVIKSHVDNEDDTAAIEEYVLLCHEALMSGNRAEIDKYVDIPSLIDMFILEELSKDVDVGAASFFIQKDIGGKLYFTAPWDFDFGYGTYGPAVNVSGFYSESGSSCEWFKALIKQPWFRKEVLARMQDLDDDFAKVIDDVKAKGAELYIAGDRNATFWNMYGNHFHSYVSGNVSSDLYSYQEHIDYLVIWMTARWDWMKENL